MLGLLFAGVAEKIHCHYTEGELPLEANHVLFVLTCETERCAERDTLDADLKQTTKHYVHTTLQYMFYIIIKQLMV